MDESNVRMPAAQPTTPPPTAPPDRPVAQAPAATLCPYCGVRVEDGPTAVRCGSCKGMLDPLSRQATQNAMGPWAVRDESAPFNPGCSFETLRTLISRGKVRRDTVVRGPTTRQFWMFAANTPGIAVLLGECHACHRAVSRDEYMCAHCAAVLSPQNDRQSLGLAPVRLLPGAASAPAIAASAVRTAEFAPPPAATHSRIIETPAPLRRGTNPLHAHPDDPAESATAALARRRNRDRAQSLTVALIVAVVAVGVVLVLLVVLAVRGSLTASDAAAATPAPSTAPAAQPQTTPQPAPSLSSAAPIPTDQPADPVAQPDAAPSAPAPMPIVAGAPVDRGLDRWHGEIERAAALEATDTLTDLDHAITVLETVLREAVAASPGDTDRFPILRARIAVMRERSVARHARDQ